MAGTACHVFRSTTRLGLTLVLGTTGRVVAMQVKLFWVLSQCAIRDLCLVITVETQWGTRMRSMSGWRSTLTLRSRTLSSPRRAAALALRSGYFPFGTPVAMAVPNNAFQ